MKIIIFGASGDLAKRKLFPALSKVASKYTEIIGYARSDIKESFPSELRKFYNYNSDFPERIQYIQGGYHDLSALKDIIDEKTVLYFSVPPKIHTVLLSNLNSYQFASIEIEKPFGEDLESFELITAHLHKNIHFIDHYLLKPLIVISNELFKEDMELFNFLSKDNVSQISCYFLETLLSEGRGYFDKTGIIKDVVQNHLTEILAAILSEKTADEKSSISRENFIKTLSIPEQEYFFGQYETYVQDFGHESSCETFAAFMCKCSLEKWSGVPIMIIAGKGMDRKATEIVFLLKPDSLKFFHHKIPRFEEIKNLIVFSKLIISVAPVNEIFLELFAQGKTWKIVLHSSNYIESMKSKIFGKNQEYEIVFDCLIKKKYFPSVSCGEARELWRIFKSINEKKKLLNFYPNGSFPKESLLYLDALEDKK